MKGARFPFVVALSIAVVSLLCIWFYPSVNDFMEGNSTWNGIRDFGSESGAITISSTADLPVSPEGTVVVVIPYLPYAREDLAKMDRFVQQGGTLLLMDDYGFGNSILVYFGVEVRFSGKPLLDPLFCFKNQWMPKIADFNNEIKAVGVKVLMLNHATALSNVGGAEVLAWSSSASFLDLDESGSQSPDEPQGPFPIAARFPFGKGTVIAVSDPSIMINSMVGQDDNRLFLTYLMNPDAEKRSEFIDDSHLSYTPLDASKTRLSGVRIVLAGPYGQLGIIAAVFTLVYGYALRKGKTD